MPTTGVFLANAAASLATTALSMYPIIAVQPQIAAGLSYGQFDAHNPNSQPRVVTGFLRDDSHAQHIVTLTGLRDSLARQLSLDLHQDWDGRGLFDPAAYLAVAVPSFPGPPSVP